MAYTIKIKEIPTAKIPIKCPYPMDAIGFCIHNTANDASAENEISYMQKNDNYTSYHYAIDDRHVVRGLPLERNSWHAGDGSTGEGNRKYIGIENCYSKSGGDRYHQAEQNAVDFLAYELYLRGWGMDRVKKHQDFSGKYCPNRILSEGRWESFLKRVDEKRKSYLKPKKEEAPKKEKDMLETAILIGSYLDYPVAQPLMIKYSAPIYEDVLPQAKRLIVVGGKVPKEYKGEVTDLTGKNRYETAEKVRKNLGW